MNRSPHLDRAMVTEVITIWVGCIRALGTV